MQPSTDKIRILENSVVLSDVFEAEYIQKTNSVMVIELCDYYYREYLGKEELLLLANELIRIANKIK